MDNGGQESEVNKTNGHSTTGVPSGKPPEKHATTPVPNQPDLVITSRGKVVNKKGFQNLRRGGGDSKAMNEAKLEKRKQELPNLGEALIRVLSEEKDGKQALDIILQAMRSRATRGSEKAADLLLTRAYGASVMRLEDPLPLPVESISGFSIDIVDETKDQTKPKARKSSRTSKKRRRAK